MTPQGPAAGVRVVAIEQSVAGPLCSRIMADLGATVIKIETPIGDFARRWDGLVGGESSYFAWLGRRKRSVVLDLKQPESRTVLHSLLDEADVLVFNISTAAARRLGLTEEAISERWPRLVSCQITGYGNRGRMSERRAYDMLVQAESGLMDLSGDQGGPARIGVSISDIGTGIYCSTLILAALLERAHTGVGRAFSVSMFQVMTEFAGPNLTAHANARVDHPKGRRRHHAISPYGVFDCSDGSIVLAIQHDDEWRRFVHQVLRDPSLDEPRFAVSASRHQHRAELEPLVERLLRALPRSEWMARLDGSQIAYASVNTIGSVWDHPVSIDLGLQGQAVMPDGSIAAVPASPAETVFGSPGPPVVPALDADGDEIRSAARARLDGQASTAESGR